MVNLESEMPYFYWTFDKIDDLIQQQGKRGFEGSVWKADLIPSYAIGEAHITFDSPAEWGEGLAPVRFHRTSDRTYEHRSEGITYDAVRADTITHTVLTGRWTETDFGKGAFIAVFPNKQRLTIPVEAIASVPVEGQSPELIAHP